VGLLAWIVGYTVRLLSSPSAWFVACDVAMVCLAALGQRWLVTDSAAADGTGWVLAVVTVTAVALQWQIRRLQSTAGEPARHRSGVDYQQAPAQHGNQHHRPPRNDRAHPPGRDRNTDLLPGTDPRHSGNDRCDHHQPRPLTASRCSAGSTRREYGR
jgi:hypothetical protein